MQENLKELNVVSRAPAVLEVQKTNLAFSWSGLKQDAGGFYVNQNESFHFPHPIITV